jgi:hypothetical protein
LLLSLGGTFFLAFGPLIIVTVSLFAGLYLVSCVIGPKFTRTKIYSRYVIGPKFTCV